MRSLVQSLVLIATINVVGVQSFITSTPSFVRTQITERSSPSVKTLLTRNAHTGDSSSSLLKLPDSDIPIPFAETKNESATPEQQQQSTGFIECFADSVAIVKGVEYTIGTPCDYAVALCYFDDEENLVPIELDDIMMDDIFPIAESIVEEEFGEELVLVRTPQTLTLVGELEEGEEDDYDEENSIDQDGAQDEDEEEVEILLTFDHAGQEVNLVKILDPVLLVGKEDENSPEQRILLTEEESDSIMPVLEELFLEQSLEEDEED